jgi:serine protease Do
LGFNHERIGLLRLYLGLRNVPRSDVCGEYARVQQEQNNGICGWIGVQVKPITAAFANSLGMAEPYGAIFDQPEPGSPAASAGIDKDDVVAAINGSPVMRSSEFAQNIADMALDSPVYLPNGAMAKISRLR